MSSALNSPHGVANSILGHGCILTPGIRTSHLLEFGTFNREHLEFVSALRSRHVKINSKLILPDYYIYLYLYSLYHYYYFSLELGISFFFFFLISLKSHLYTLLAHKMHTTLVVAKTLDKIVAFFFLVCLQSSLTSYLYYLYYVYLYLYVSIVIYYGILFYFYFRGVSVEIFSWYSLLVLLRL